MPEVQSQVEPGGDSPVGGAPSSPAPPSARSAPSPPLSAPAPPSARSAPSPPLAATPLAAARPGLPWGTLALLVVALLVLWGVRPGVPPQAPLGEAPPPVSGIQAWIVPSGASAAPTHSGSLDFKSLAGRVVLLEFYATWCSPCQASLATLNQREPDPRLVVVALTAVDERQSATRIRTFASEQRFPTALVSSEALQAYGVRQIPYAVLVGHGGRVVWKGSPLEADFGEALRAALQAAPSQRGPLRE